MLPVTCTASLALDDVRDLTAAVRRLRRLLDLDADPVAVVQALGSDPVLGPSVTAMPGLRTPGHVDGGELALRQYSANRSALRALVRSQVALPQSMGEACPTRSDR